MDFLNESSVNISDRYSNLTKDGLPGSVILPTVYGVICLLGVAGNCAVIHTILKKTKRRRRRTAPDILILNLSVVDLLFLLGMPFLIHQLLGNGAWRFGAAMCTAITVLDSTSQTASTYLLITMTLDRYLATVHPIRSNDVRTPRAASLAVALVWAVSLVTVLPVWMYVGLMPLPGGLEGCALLLPDPATDTYWFTLYQFLLAFALPLAAICLVYARILRHMATSVAPLPPRSLRVRTRRVTRMAVAICLLFFVCWAPYYGLQLVHLGVQKPSAAFAYAYHVAISMGYANSCMNPLLYLTLSDTFKRRLLLAVRPPSRRRRAVGPGTPGEGGHLSLRPAPQGASARGQLQALPSASLPHSRSTGEEL